jgi:HEAT repeat protein
MNASASPSPLRTIAGYPYLPLLSPVPTHADGGMAERLHIMLMDGQLARVKEMVAARPQLLADLLPIVANPEASINVRLGASVVFEAHAGSAALRALVPRLGELSRDADARVRADACHYLGLSAHERAREFLAPRLDDENAEVREIAADSLDELAAAKS